MHLPWVCCERTNCGLMDSVPGSSCPRSPSTAGLFSNAGRSILCVCVCVCFSGDSVTDQWGISDLEEAKRHATGPCPPRALGRSWWGDSDILSASGGRSGWMFSLLQGLMEAVQLGLEGGLSPQDLCPGENTLVQGFDSRPVTQQGAWFPLLVHGAGGSRLSDGEAQSLAGCWPEAASALGRPGGFR